MKIRIGVMGSAHEKHSSKKISQKVKKLSQQIGREIAKHNCVLVNGACGGVPEAAAEGAKDAGGFTLGISPANSFQEHIKNYKFPYKNFDIIIYTGFGFKGRNVVNVSNCDAVIVIEGSSGTLNEFSIAYDEGMLIGVLKGSGGIADSINTLEKVINKKTGAKIITDKKPTELIHKILKELKKRNKKTPFYKLTKKEDTPVN